MLKAIVLTLSAFVHWEEKDVVKKKKWKWF